jgi:hypothetical protein
LPTVRFELTGSAGGRAIATSTVAELRQAVHAPGNPLTGPVRYALFAAVEHRPGSAHEGRDSA